MSDFDDSTLDDPQALTVADTLMRELASVGARIRTEAAAVTPCSSQGLSSLRGVVTVGKEARLVRAVLEPTSRVPFVAWPFAGLPAWVGALDLVIVLGSGAGDDPSLLSTVGEAVKRGAALIVAAEEDSLVARAARSSATQLVATRTGDPLAAAIAVMSILHDIRLGPEVVPADTAEVADMAAENASPFRDLSDNPAKDLAVALADAQPLVWGGSVLAARAGRRVAEALRRASGRAALASGSEELLLVIEGAPPRDPFADPGAGPALRPVLIIRDDQANSPEMDVERQRLVAAARAHDVRVVTLDAGRGSDLDCYVSLLQQGRYGAAYLSIGLGRRLGA
ncbi:SIS regulatory protein [Propionibacterium freudenreichii]|uniref:SIS domain-containing protein n=1 Tax=Propionibacterium freudenreichii TaxID=1744 RepID=UPI000BC32AF8|nr:SIS domain-containing protein [Propionibacterium freudenreichii]SBN95944.1 SIS regulatory protein [Propionibacterium freudenreichii]SCC97530.1 SIS regulatory protein [Propionibacterium freudenreichii]